MAGRTNGYDSPGRMEDRQRREELWSDYLVWTKFNNELLRRIFDSPEMALEYSRPREPEATWGIFLAEIEEFQRDLGDDVQRLASIS